MRRILLDTNAYVAFKEGLADVVAILQQADLIGISVIVLGELLAGFAVGSRAQENLVELHEFLNTSRVTLLSIDADTPSFYAQIYANLPQKGKPIPTNDLWIAAIALQQGYKICTFDKHFQVIDNIVVATTLEKFLF